MKKKKKKKEKGEAREEMETGSIEKARNW